MVRLLAFTLGVALLYALYLPAVNPPEAFVARLRHEHDLHAALFGEARAQKVLQQALRWYAHQDDLVPAAFAAAPSAAPPHETTAVSQHMANALERLFHNAYTRSFDALVLLAAYRLAGVLWWAQWLAVFILVACFDGYLVRLIRSQEFLEHSPLHFAISAIGATLALAVLLLLLVIPVSVAPLVTGSALLTFGVLIAIALSHFHR